jgi:hypothetical protein
VIKFLFLFLFFAILPLSHFPIVIVLYSDVYESGLLPRRCRIFVSLPRTPTIPPTWQTQLSMSQSHVMLYSVVAHREAVSVSRPSIHKVFFPAPVSADVMDSVSMMNGICGNGGCWRTIRSGRGLNAHHVQAAKIKRVWTGWLSAPAMAGWKSGLEQRDGAEMQVAIWIHYWTSPEKETEGKSAETEPCTPGVHNPHMPAWLQELRDAGALFWSEEHWESFPIRKTLKLNELALDLNGNPLSIPKTRNE